jgi:uncharacterized SAM-binding protein YcdF (DUF218 family)
VINSQLWRAFGPATWPVWLVVLGLIAAAWPAARRWLRRPLLAGATIVLVLAMTPVGIRIIRVLEDRYPIPDLANVPVTDIVVVTGPEESAFSARSHRLELSGAGERITEGAALKHRFPNATLWIIGGVRDDRYPLYDYQWTQAGWAAMGFASRGVGGTHNTYENAIGAKAAGVGARPVLVTSGWHMPRTMACFRARGFAPIAYPVDFQAGPDTGWNRDWEFRPALNLARADLAIHEWIGLGVYRLRGWIGPAF